MGLETICNALNEKYNLEELLDGTLDIEEILSDIEVVNYLNGSNKKIEDIEEYILKNII